MTIPFKMFLQAKLRLSFCPFRELGHTSPLRINVKFRYFNDVFATEELIVSAYSNDCVVGCSLVSTEDE